MARSKTKSSQRNKLAKQSQTNAKKKPSRASNSRSGTTKHDRVLDLLRAKGGTTIAAITKATGWQPYSVRGFLAGVAKKKLGFSLSSEKTDAGRVYRIIATGSP
jgi:Protein of unknown function (DUF3489)